MNIYLKAEEIEWYNECHPICQVCYQGKRYEIRRGRFDAVCFVSDTSQKDTNRIKKIAQANALFSAGVWSKETLIDWAKANGLKFNRGRMLCSLSDETVQIYLKHNPIDMQSHTPQFYAEWYAM